MVPRSALPTKTCLVVRPHDHVAEEVGPGLGRGHSTAATAAGGEARSGASNVDVDLDRALRSLLAERGASKTVCPSEVARAVGGEQWRELMEPARAAARRSVARGEAEITQHGQVVDPSTAKGPIRIRPTTPAEVRAAGPARRC